MDKSTRHHSRYWKLSATSRRPDIYVSCQGLGFLHLSLHEDLAYWHLRVVTEDGTKTTDFPVPAEFAPGYLNAVEIRVPAAVVDETTAPPSGVTWVAKPEGDPPLWVRFHVVIEPSGAPSSIWPGMRNGDALVGRIPMPDGRTACVTVSITDALEVTMKFPDQASLDEFKAAIRRSLEEGSKAGTLAWGYSPEVGIWVMVGRAELASGA